MPTVRLSISGMHCGSCVAHVEAALRKQPGVQHVSVNLATEAGTIQTDDALVGGASTLCEVVERAGYHATLVADDAASGALAAAANMRSLDEAAAWKRRALIALPIATITMALMFAPAGWGLWTVWVQLALVAPLQAFVGWPFYIGALRALRHGRADMDTLVALGTSAALGLSAWQVVMGAADEHATHSGLLHHGVYFDTSAMILALVALGKWMEARTRRAAGEAIASLERLQPTIVSVERGGVMTEIPLAQLRENDLVLTKPGTRFAADGEVLGDPRHGAVTAVDEAMMTGESTPVAKSPGDVVIGGSLNLTGAVRWRVTRTGARSLLGQIASMVDSAQGRKASVQRIADQAAGWLVPLVLVISALSLVGFGVLKHDWTAGIVAAVSVLVVACPCAMGLAVPTAIMVGTGIGAARGIVIKDPAALERAGDLRIIVLDKTGTLTMGQPSVRQIRTLVAIDEAELLRLAASVEALSEHPLGLAIVHEASSRGLTVKPCEQFRVLPGRGARGMLEGVEVFVGRIDEASDAAQYAEAVAMMERAALTVVAVIEGGVDGRGGRARGLIGVGDEIKPFAAEAVAALKAEGLRVMMLTGDQEFAAQAVAQQVGIDEVRSRVRPEEKERIIRELQAGSAGSRPTRVAMVGDGINDAPALAAADVGIAIGGRARSGGPASSPALRDGSAPHSRPHAAGTDIAAQAGHMILMGDLRQLPAAIRLSRAMTRRIRLGLWWAFGYNLILVPIAALGWLHPMLAALAMSVSSVSVVGNALWLRRVGLD